MNNQKQVEKVVERLSLSLTREQVRAKLLAAGILSQSVNVPKRAVQLTAEERERIGQLPPGSPTTTDILDKDRGEV